VEEKLTAIVVGTQVVSVVYTQVRQYHVLRTIKINQAQKTDVHGM